MDPRSNLSQSADRPLTSDSTKFSEASSRPVSSRSNAGFQIGALTNEMRPIEHVGRKKRRSSLSDVTKLQQTVSTDLRSPLQPRNLNIGDIAPRRVNAAAEDRVVRKAENVPLKKENQNASKIWSQENTPAKLVTKDPSHEVSITSGFSIQSGLTKEQDVTQVSGFSDIHNDRERSGTASENREKGEPLRKMRIHSPQKVRERIQRQQQHFTSFSDGLQMEIDRIGKEMSSLQPGPRLVASSERTNHDAHTQLAVRLDKLTEQLQSAEALQATVTNNLRRDLDGSLSFANQRAQRLEGLYREANAENEALYDRFNDELGRVLGKVKRGEGVDELRSQLKGALKEARELRSERAVLRKDLAQYQSQSPTG